MKKINILIWILSLVIAIALWGYVAFEVNPESDITINGIPVYFINELELSNRELVIVGGRDATVDVRFTGRFQNLRRVSRETISARIDLRQITSAGETMVDFELEGEGLSYLNAYPTRSMVLITTDRIVSRYIDLSFEFLGDVAEGFGRESVILEPPTIQINGPSVLLSTISSAAVRYEPPEPLTRSVANRPVGYVLLDEAGEIIESEHITDSLVGPIEMTLPVFMTRQVRLSVGFIEGGGLTSQNIVWSFEPESVMIAGDPALVENMATLQAEQINLAELRGDIVRTIQIPYPDDIRNMDATESAELRISIEGVSTREIPTTNIVITGISGEFELVSDVINVTIRGPEDELNEIAPNAIRVVADFSGVDIPNIGIVSAPAEIFVDGATSVGAIDLGYTVEVLLP